MTEWYNQIEPGIRDTVKLLRDNGFNTQCSCEHIMEIECSWLIDGELMRLHDLLFNTGYRNYIISLEHTVIDGHSRTFTTVKIGEKS